MSYETDVAYWKRRVEGHGRAGVGYGCNEKLMRWDNLLRSGAVARLTSIAPGTTLLDAGTGTGHWALKYAKAGARVVALDFNEELLEIARARAERSGLEVTWLHGALEEADLPENHFDVALSVTCLQHITERARQARAVRRILDSLRSDGSFVLLEDTFARDERVEDYLLGHSQKGWIDLVESQGAQLLDLVGVSFVRFPLARLGIPSLLCVGADYLLSRISRFRGRATVTAFAFGIRR